MDLPAFADILNNGSAWSRECEAILAELAGTAPAPTRSLGEALDALQTVEKLGKEHGIPVVILGEARAICASAVRMLGPDTPIDRLADVTERTTGVPLKG